MDKKLFAQLKTVGSDARKQLEADIKSNLAKLGLDSSEVVGLNSQRTKGDEEVKNICLPLFLINNLAFIMEKRVDPSAGDEAVIRQVANAATLAHIIGKSKQDSKSILTLLLTNKEYNIENIDWDSFKDVANGGEGKLGINDFKAPTGKKAGQPAKGDFVKADPVVMPTTTVEPKNTPEPAPAEPTKAQEPTPTQVEEPKAPKPAPTPVEKPKALEPTPTPVEKPKAPEPAPTPAPVEPPKVPEPVPAPVEQPKAPKPIPTPVEKPKVTEPVPAPVEQPKAPEPVPTSVEKPKAPEPVPTPAPPEPPKAPEPVPAPAEKPKAPEPVPTQEPPKAPAPKQGVAKPVRPKNKATKAPIETQEPTPPQTPSEPVPYDPSDFDTLNAIHGGKAPEEPTLAQPVQQSAPAPQGQAKAPLVFKMPKGFGRQVNVSVWNTPVITDFGYPFLNFSSEAMVHLFRTNDEADRKRTFKKIKAMLKEAKKRYGGIWSAIYGASLELLKKFAIDPGTICVPNYLRVDTDNLEQEDTINVTPIKYFSVDPEFEGSVDVPREFLENFYDVLDYTKSFRTYAKYSDGLTQSELLEEIRNNDDTVPYYILVPKQAKFSRSEVKPGTLFSALFGGVRCVMLKAMFRNKRGCFLIEKKDASKLYSDIN